MKIDSEIHTGTVPKESPTQVQKGTHQGNFPTQVKEVTPGISRMAVTMANLKCSDNTRQQLSTSVQSDLVYIQGVAICIKAIVGVVFNREHVQDSTANPTVTGKTADHAKKQAAYAKSAATSSSDRNRQFYKTAPVRTEPTTGRASLDARLKEYIRKDIDKDIKAYEKVFDLGKKHERKKEYCALAFRERVWHRSLINAQESAFFSKKTLSNTENKVKPSDCIFSYFNSLDVLCKDEKQDEEFVQIIDEMASFARFNENDKKKIKSFVEQYINECDMAEYSLEIGTDREMVRSLFTFTTTSILHFHRDLFSTFGMQCKLVSELRKSNLDIMDCFRRYVIVQRGGGPSDSPSSDGH